MPTDIALPGGQPYSGWVKCDELMPVRKERLRRQVGAVSREHLARIEAGVRLVLAR
ncbi:MAG: type II toxin-antitoxin system PemK/MazF family toxin [Nocardiopsaceae bacterium]|nr:type II toxin-antitoxin system PemK/MazF family toxin [Nocardiopsaceae bacterium]